MMRLRAAGIAAALLVMTACTATTPSEATSDTTTSGGAAATTEPTTTEPTTTSAPSTSAPNTTEQGPKNMADFPDFQVLKAGAYYLEPIPDSSTRVSFTVPEGWLVGATGTLVNAADVLSRQTRDRLAQAGLGEACLELHSKKANKRAVVQELARRAELPMPRVFISDKLETGGVALLEQAGLEVDNRPGLKGEGIYCVVDRIEAEIGLTALDMHNKIEAGELDLDLHPDTPVYVLPNIAGFVGSDTVGVILASGMHNGDAITLAVDVGTNGETVLGNRDWLVTCACSAGPAFEGAGVVNGMRATQGAIEEVWINSETLEPTYRVIGGGKPKGICGSGLISLLSEAFITGVLDKAGNINLAACTSRVREGTHGGEYVVVWGADSATGEDIVISRVDVDNLLRAKAAIYAGFTVLADTVGIPLETTDKVLIGGSFGKYINVEKAVQIGLLPDMDWSRFEFLGNTSVKGAYYALLDWRKRERITEIAKRMTYVELSADNSFYEAFTSALFLPHTDLHKFPSVAEALESKQVDT